MSESTSIAEFTHRLHADWLPAYCNDPGRCYSLDGFRPESIVVTEVDARDFLRAIDSGIIVDHGGGRYRLPHSSANEVLFWEGSKTATPRPITLWMEPVITFATIARLHLDHGWPRECLGMQSVNWEFDFTAFPPGESSREYIAGEVKKSERELSALVEYLHAICRDRGLAVTAPRPAQVNAFKKWQGLNRSQAPIFWAVGPGGLGQVFRVAYDDGVAVALETVSHDHLAFAGLGTSLSHPSG